VLLPTVARVLEIVELLVVPAADGIAVGRLGRRTFDQRASQFFAQVLEEIEPIGRLLEPRRTAAIFQAVERPAHVWQPEDRIPQRTQLSRRGAPQRGPARQALQIADTVEGLP